MLKKLRIKLLHLRCHIEMSLAIRKINHIHSELKETRYNERENRQFIVLLSLPTEKGWKERLHWVNRKNFRKLKDLGWMQRHVRYNELKEKAFYISDPSRSYQDEYKAKKQAISRYKTYITVTRW